MVAIAAQYDMRIHQVDVTSAYLNGKLDEEILMEIPRHIEKPLDILIKTSDKVCLMRKALYGRKQAGRSWHRRLDDESKKFGVIPSSADPCVYYQGRGEEILLVLVYVDDILIASRDLGKINSFKNHLKTAFEIKDLNNIKCCLGIEFNRSDRAIQLHQQRYIEDLLDHFGMKDCKPVSTPLELGVKLQKECEDTGEDNKEFPFRELMGSLMYLAANSSLEFLFKWEADEFEDNIILSRIKKLAIAHVPAGWREWKIQRYTKDE
ncbi:hypothetical protein KPH14_001397 [Odynerus spinipes]|uniref:Reverse transcriptase Ty1/copia-type domain-containing protein n=1 Tax=Odynerus spinipes TaxID=1348599 RepID=A0AAD9VKM8_9HYME|nr:hypothetical protein KPH14_001397 [Odynerus spinipes]